MTKICLNCNEECDDSYNFCRTCGAKLPEVKSEEKNEKGFFAKIGGKNSQNLKEKLDENKRKKEEQEERRRRKELEFKEKLEENKRKREEQKKKKKQEKEEWKRMNIDERDELWKKKKQEKKLSNRTTTEKEYDFYFEDMAQQFKEDAKKAERVYKAYVTYGVSRLEKINGRFLASQLIKLDLLNKQNKRIIEQNDSLIEQNGEIIDLLTQLVKK